MKWSFNPSELVLQSDRYCERTFLSLNQLLSWVSGVLWSDLKWVCLTLFCIAPLKGYNQVWYQPIPQSQFVMSQTKDHFSQQGHDGEEGTVHDDYILIHISYFLKKMSHKAQSCWNPTEIPSDLCRAWHPLLHCLQKLFQKIKDLKVIQMYIRRYLK